MAKKQTYDFDLIVIGSGASGSAAATIAARAGKNVAIVEADTFGGDSSNWSDVPTKSLLHAAQLYDEARQGARFGLRTNTVGYNYPSIRAWKDLAVKRTGAGGNRKYYTNEGMSTFQGRAHFLSPHEISVGRRQISARQFLIATGSQWELPDIQGLDTVKYLTPRTILESIRPPKSLYIIGAGTVGVEIAQLMATFGTKVYLSDIASRILPHEDEDVGQLMAELLHARKGVSILTQTRTLAVEKENIAKRVTYTRGGTQHSVRVDEVLVAGGRVASVDLGLENAGVEYTPKGIEVDEHLQTTAKHIFAAGDVLGRSNSFTHTALLEGQIAAHNILHRNRVEPDYTANPRLTFTFPGVASVGMTEVECIKRDLHVKTGLAPLSVIPRSNTSDFRDGFVKVVADKKGVVIGATVVAPHAAEIIHELALAIRYGLTAAQVAEAPHAFLSWSEAVRVAAARAMVHRR